MTTAEHQFKQGAGGSIVEDTFQLDPAQNTVGASAQFVFRSPEGETNTVRSASFETEDDDATEITFQRIMGLADVQTEGVYLYEWKLTLASGEVLIFPQTGATDDYPERKTYTFEIIEALSPAEEPSEDDPILAASNLPLAVDDIDALIGLPASVNYKLVFVLSDENESLASFEFDAAIVATDAPNEYALTAGGGGFRRKGI